MLYKKIIFLNCRKNSKIRSQRLTIHFGIFLGLKNWVRKGVSANKSRGRAAEGGWFFVKLLLPYKGERGFVCDSFFWWIVYLEIEIWHIIAPLDR